jgi:Fe-S cluster assembly iron-binding protein IscA
MFEVSPKAKKKLDQILDDREAEGAIRLMPVSGGCAGTSLDLFFDEATDADVRLDHSDVDFIIDKALYDQAKPIFIDYSDNPVTPGFIVSSGLDSGAACGGCCGC